MVKLTHEAPLSIMNDLRYVSDYDYALVHLFETNNKYFEFFKNSLTLDREVYLDNSLFELGKAFDTKEYAKWIEKLQPTYYILPDVFQDNTGTVNESLKFAKEYRSLPGKTIAVCQGSSFIEQLRCYNDLASNDLIDMIAIPFRTPHHELNVNDFAGEIYCKAEARRQWIMRMEYYGNINKDKPHHLLGCHLPQEFSHYEGIDTSWITSIDTSNPVAHAMKDYRYESWGLSLKDEAKVAENMDLSKSEINMDLVYYNIEEFKRHVTKGF